MISGRYPRARRRRIMASPAFAGMEQVMNTMMRAAAALALLGTLAGCVVVPARPAPRPYYYGHPYYYYPAYPAPYYR
ncbi:hypothetical protein L541_1532 [Bordetella hinzii CA90 BAL1384]|uniref:Lipoprotein n=3 Tax=Bordetella hinzii TaxID=103855 RepID=A0ABR4QUH7_9BORD|nr:hypothetical protein L544_1183 [Bordetella hinzii OH87 BAL007II]KCB26823.1 hypothetical protein L543_0992 [Bordetella hinzii L60]KCB33433.1 hypothetical protein L541_1532 [Bordetella hinzii CA90 BAL1384]KCB43853.1 hypothetical protein L539_1434 [Bordetella hinzii 5132]KCB49143.1 hypothetical protein L537_1450 [Bordetella hinzii 1277]KCB49871.1 hypothetical protein L538_1210 [Bordetella hinzii 4161]KXA74558.1 hypothetical protein AXA74_01510 [Bordetella hinzii LMG 13501]QDJ33677.1 hypothet